MSAQGANRLLSALIALPICLFAGLSPHEKAQAKSDIGTTAVVHGLQWDLHEMTIGQVKQMAKTTGFISQAEREGGGYVYEAGWTKKSGWTWRTPFGVPALDRELSLIHISEPTRPY